MKSRTDRSVKQPNVTTKRSTERIGWADRKRYSLRMVRGSEFDDSGYLGGSKREPVDDSTVGRPRSMSDLGGLQLQSALGDRRSTVDVDVGQRSASLRVSRLVKLLRVVRL